MNSLFSVILIHSVVVFTGRLTEGRALRDVEEPVLLSALCLQDGRIRDACLQDISTVSIQRFLDTLLDKIRDNNRYNAIMEQLDLQDDQDDDLIKQNDVIPIQSKRGRSRSDKTSGFYSNW